MVEQVHPRTLCTNTWRDGGVERERERKKREKERRKPCSSRYAQNWGMVIGNRSAQGLVFMEAGDLI